jgi:hypothetical protein
MSEQEGNAQLTDIYFENIVMYSPTAAASVIPEYI